MANERAPETTMDVDSLYLEEVITDRKVGMIRRLTPVLANGGVDAARPVLFMGQAEIMTNMGPVPLNFDLPGPTLEQAAAGFGAAAAVAIEQTVRQIQEMRRQQASQLVVPQGGLGGMGGPGPGLGGGKIQIP
ncbi:MAG: hypothetical protein ABL964_12400 [Steroidobacteraceae bacterium]